MKQYGHTPAWVFSTIYLGGLFKRRKDIIGMACLLISHPLIFLFVIALMMILSITLGLWFKGEEIDVEENLQAQKDAETIQG